MKFINPCHDMLTIDLDHDEGKTETGIYVPGSNRWASGIVKQKGSKAANVSYGDRVVFDRALLVEIEFAGEKFHLVRENNILGSICEVDD